MGTETELAAPSLLIAVPQLGDPNFTRSVVFILEHGEHGSMGLVINRPSSLPMDAFCHSQSIAYQGEPAALLYQGGPVQTDRAFILHGRGHQGPETEQVTESMFLSYSLESLRLLAEDPPAHLRIYLGYAGWGPDQLAQEISAGAWLVHTPSEDLVFAVAPENMWEAALRELGIEAVQLMHSGTLH